MCRLVDGDPICVQTCEPASASPGCPSGYVCDVTGCNVGSCVMGSPGPSPLDAPCTVNADCISNYCYEDLGGARFCAVQCVDGAACSSGRVCMTGGFPCGACRVDGPVLLPFGSACTSPSECEEGVCMDDACSRACTLDSECPGDYRCEGGACVRGAPVPAGEPCTSGDECADGAPECIDVDGELVCAAPCTDGTCEAGFVCADDRCVREGAALGERCGENAECRSGLCASTCTRVCDETRTCPTGFDCVAAGTVSGCFPSDSGMDPPSDGGCSIANGASSGLAPFIGLAAAALLARRRRSRR
jgi:hypothetical protein